MPWHMRCVSLINFGLLLDLSNTIAYYVRRSTAHNTYYVAMSFKAQDESLTPVLMDAREKEVMQEIEQLIDKKLYFALARIIPDHPNASSIVEDAEIQEQSKNLKAAVAAVIDRHQAIISTIAKSKKDKETDHPV